MAKDPVCGMNVDEKTGLKLTSENGTFYFCSEHCMKKFAENRKTEPCPSCVVNEKKFYRNKVFIVSSLLLVLTSLSYFVGFLAPFRVVLFMYFRKIWWAMLLGFLLGGVIEHFVPREYISKILAKPKKRTVFYSVALGFLMSACSHGILALSIELHRKGASTSSVVSFLLASPWANLTMTVMLVGFFGLRAFYIIISAIFIAITTGLVFQHLERKNLIEKNVNTSSLGDDFSIWDDVKKRAKAWRHSKISISSEIKGILSGSISLANMVLWWILIGMGLSSLAGAYIPSHIFHKYMGPTALGLFATLVVATVIEVCSEGTAPLAFEIFRQTGALGNSFVFLMAGVATDYTEIGLIWTNIGKKAAVWMLAVAVPQVILLGMLANVIFR